jgi:adenine-specific DNA-methyltransferase
MTSKLRGILQPPNVSKVADTYREDAEAVLFPGDCRKLLSQIPDASIQLVVTSPPYNVGKRYEKKVDLQEYLNSQKEVIEGCIRKLKPGGSICWQVGNHVADGEVFPLDVLLYPYFKAKGLRLRNRIVWTFEHGLHCNNRLSGRHETILWFTNDDAVGEYIFNLDPIRVPQKYPGKKYFKGPNAGKPSSNPLGKNPGDVWNIPNVKHNHPEKTTHPCQFPIELVERLVLSLTNEGDTVLDPYMGVGSAVAAALLHQRKGIGAEIAPEYVAIAKERIHAALQGTLPRRPRNRPVYEPPANTSLTRNPWQVQRELDV